MCSPSSTAGNSSATLIRNRRPVAAGVLPQHARTDADPSATVARRRPCDFFVFGGLQCRIIKSARTI